MTTTTAPTLPSGPVDWARRNLFNTWYNALLTFALGVPIAFAAVRAVRFLFVTGRWEAIQTNLTSVMVGLYPRTDVWRAWVALHVALLAIGVAVGATGRTLEARAELAQETTGGAGAALRRWWPLLLFVVVVLVFSGSIVTASLAALGFALVAAGWLGARRLPLRVARYAPAYGLVGIGIAFAVLVLPGRITLEDHVGGLLLTILLASSSIVLSFPLGILAALGRRSSFPAFRIVAVGYIEFIRGVPLITLLFMGSLALQFFFPPAWVPNLVIRAIIILTLFTGAYVAEIVRGGLQSVPRGQVEAAQALGLSPLKVLRRIVLPQALRNVIPALVGQFISLLKDTSLVLIIGLLDVLRVLFRLIPNQPDFQGQGLLPELLAFAAFTYWVFAYTMSRESQRIERRLGVGER